MEDIEDYIIDPNDIKSSGIDRILIPTVENDVIIPDKNMIDEKISNYLISKVDHLPYWKTNSTYVVNERVNVFDMDNNYSEDIENENSAFFLDHWREENLSVVLKDHPNITSFPIIALCLLIDKRFVRILVELLLQLIDIHNVNKNSKFQSKIDLVWNPDVDLFNTSLKSLMNRVIYATMDSIITRKQFEEALLGFTFDARPIIERTFTPVGYQESFRNIISFMFGYGYDINVEVLHVKDKEARVRALGEKIDRLRMDLLKNFQFPEIAKNFKEKIEETQSEQNFIRQSIQTTSVMSNILHSNRDVFSPTILPMRLPIPTKSFSKMMAIAVASGDYISPLYAMPYFYIIDIMRKFLSRKYEAESYHFARLLRSNFPKEVASLLEREITTYNVPVVKENSNLLKLPGSLIIEEKWNAAWTRVFAAFANKSSPPTAMQHYYDTITVLMRIGVNPNICVQVGGHHHPPMEILFTYFIYCDSVDSHSEIQYILDLVDQMMKAGYNLQLSPGTSIIGAEEIHQLSLLERLCSIHALKDSNLQKLLLPCLYYGSPPLSVVYKCLIWCILNGQYQSATQICKRLFMLDVGLNMHVGFIQNDGKVIRQIRITPLLAAIYSNKPLMVDMLLRRGANPNGLTSTNGLERPILAALKRDNGILDLLLAKLTSDDYRLTHLFFNEPYENGTLVSRILQFGSVLDISVVLKYAIISPVDPIKIAGQGTGYWFAFNNLMEYSQYLRSDAVNQPEPNKSKQIAISELLYVYFQTQAKYVQ